MKNLPAEEAEQEAVETTEYAVLLSQTGLCPPMSPRHLVAPEGTPVPMGVSGLL